MELTPTWMKNIGLCSPHFSEFLKQSEYETGISSIIKVTSSWFQILGSNLTLSQLAFTGCPVNGPNPVTRIFFGILIFQQNNLGCQFAMKMSQNTCFELRLRDFELNFPKLLFCCLCKFWLFQVLPFQKFYFQVKSDVNFCIKYHQTIKSINRKRRNWWYFSKFAVTIISLMSRKKVTTITTPCLIWLVVKIEEEPATRIQFEWLQMKNFINLDEEGTSYPDVSIIPDEKKILRRWIS